MRFKTVSSPHKLGSSSVTKVMSKVLIALLPGIALSTYFFGWGILTNVLFSCVFALFAEAIVLLLRKRSLKPPLTDLSVIVTAVLLALSIPPYAPLWMIAVGIIFAVIFGKHLYGGLGYNPFNPAMVGYVVLIISFPVQMSQWPEANQNTLTINETVAYISGDYSQYSPDAISGATALDHTKTQLKQSLTLNEIQHNDVFGRLGSQYWEWIALAYLLGGILLIALKVMPWHAPAAMLLILFVIAQLFHYYDPDYYASGLFHLFSGGAMLGAFFIITDPVSGTTSNKGRLLFGALVALLVYTIRTWGGYPDGIAFAVLLANMAAPMIDYYTKPRVFGTGRQS